MLSEIDLHLLDVIANFEPIQKYDLYELWFTKNKKLTDEEINESINRLSNSGQILIKKDEYDREIITIAPGKRNEVLSTLKKYWEEKVQKEKLLQIAERNDQEVLKLLELKASHEGKTYFVISDYYYDRLSLNFCEKLLDINMLFKTTYSSRKHYYESYYLRKTPVDVESELQNYILSKVNVESFKLDPDWRILLLPMFTDSPINIIDIETIFPNLTRYEIMELLKKLEEKRAITISGDQISIPKAVKDIIKTNFLLKNYTTFESFMIEQLRKRIGESVSNLYLLGMLKRVLMFKDVKVDGPFAIIQRSSIQNIDLNNLKEAAKLGIMFLTEDKIIIAKKVLDELEIILRSKIYEKVIRIPANDIYAAITTWKRIFGEECKEYIKIQDEYVNEDTLRILQSYSSPQIDLTILTSIEGARDLDIEEMKHVINEIKSSGRKLKMYFIGDNLGKAPFHFRYIISKDCCYSISTSIKQVGKTKDADIIPLTKEEKNGLVEPAFDYWVSLPPNKLKEKGITRMEFHEWMEQKFRF
jgi:hypothetical protein